jgi:quinoprotein glucose dehydrogenase
MSSLMRLGCLSVALISTPVMAQQPVWGTFNGDLKAQKYSPLNDITPTNVATLRRAWQARTGDVATGATAPAPSHMHGNTRKGQKIPATVWSATPLYVNETLYLGTPFYRIFALEPDTGKTRWVYDTKSKLEALTQPDLKNRGVAYWQAANIVAGARCEKRVYIGTMDGKLHSVDADTGLACADFGNAGVVNVDQWNVENPKWPLSVLQPPTVYKDTLFVGWAGKDWAEEVAPPGTVFALDARSGKKLWEFRALDAQTARTSGTANVWASMSIDAERDLLFIPVSSPSPNFFGGNRLGKVELATSVTALDTNSGRIVWSRQLVHHDIWDYDTNAAPTLVDVTKDGVKIPALVQTSKQGFIYVLNRETGEPIYPIEERPVPASTVPGEKSSPTQPHVARPKPVSGDRWPGVYWLSDLASFGYCSRTASKLLDKGRFTPPSLEGSIVYPGTIGGIEWGGGAVDPNSGVYVVNYSSAVQLYKLIPRAQYNSVANSKEGLETGGFFPQTGAPYGVQLLTFLNPLGMPCWKPPYGSIAAYDLKTGEQLWNEPFGQVQQYGFYMPESWGSITIGGPTITASGLIFIGASMDARVRALDIKTGKVLWKALVDAPAVSLPAIYKHKGKQYVVWAVGGNSILTPKVSDQVIAFALPD